MKKFISLILIAVMILSVLCSCGDNGKTSTSSDTKIKVVTTNFPAYDFMREIGGDKIDLSMLVPPGTETHSYEPSPKDIKDIESSDIFAYTGGESDEWVDDIIESLDSADIITVKMMELTETVPEEMVEGMEDNDDHEDEHEDVEYDEHVWTSPIKTKSIVKGFAAALIKEDSSNKDYYESNLKSYENELDDLDKEFNAVSDSSQRDTIIVGDRFPFKYLVDEYNLKYYAAFPGCSVESDGSPATIAFLIDKTKDEKIPVVFTIELSTGKIADTICDSTGAKKLILNSCHNVTAEQFENGTTYIDLMKENAKNLKEALN